MCVGGYPRHARRAESCETIRSFVRAYTESIARLNTTLSADSKRMLERFHLDAGDEVYVVETSDGLLITPFGPDFADA